MEDQVTAASNLSSPPPEGLLSWCSSSLIRHHHLYRCMLERRANLFLWIMTLPAHSELSFYFQHTGFLLKHFPLAQVLSSSFSGHLNTFSSSVFYSTYFSFFSLSCLFRCSISSQEIYYCLRRQALFSVLLHVIITLHYPSNRPFVIS